jgi:DNA-binding LytR/AlgR family response regulator
MTIRALIAEDEPILAATLAKALNRTWPELEIAAICPNGIEAVTQALALAPAVLFLDIKMPGKTGLEAAEDIANAWEGPAPFPQIVFVTAYDEYAVAAFERDAADYVLKPVNDVRLSKTVERLRARLATPADGHDLSQLLAQMRTLLPAAPAAERLTMIRAAVGNQVRMIPIADVVYFEASDKYVSVVTTDSESLIRVSLRDLLPQLDPQQFWQIHRGTIVNAASVASAARDEMGKVSVQLRTRPERLRVSPLYAHLFRQM